MNQSINRSKNILLSQSMNKAMNEVTEPISEEIDEAISIFSTQIQLSYNHLKKIFKTRVYVHYT